MKLNWVQRNLNILSRIAWCVFFLMITYRTIYWCYLSMAMLRFSLVSTAITDSLNRQVVDCVAQRVANFGIFVCVAVAVNEMRSESELCAESVSEWSKWSQFVDLSNCNCNVLKYLSMCRSFKLYAHMETKKDINNLLYFYLIYMVYVEFIFSSFD